MRERERENEGERGRGRRTLALVGCRSRAILTTEPQAKETDIRRIRKEKGVRKRRQNQTINPLSLRCDREISPRVQVLF